MSAHATSHDLEEVARAVLKWWEEHQYDTMLTSVDDGYESNIYDEPPEFVLLARAAIEKAMLCSAAPDMLSLLQEVQDRPLITEYTDWWLRVSAAIAKAIGEKP